MKAIAFGTKDIIIKTESELSELLAENGAHANGKNQPIYGGKLYPTVAESALDYENLFATYLAKPGYAWMAVWMAMTSRDVIRKRDIRYHAPEGPDQIGRVDIFGADPRTAINGSGVLYLLSERRIGHHRDVDVSGVENDHKIAELVGSHLFLHDRATKRNGDNVPAVIDNSGLSTRVSLDAWQVAITNRLELTPDFAISLSGGIRDALIARAERAELPIGGDYLVQSA